MSPLEKNTDGKLVLVNRAESFKPAWDEEPRSDGVYEDNNIVARSKYPDTLPEEVNDLILPTYNKSHYRKPRGGPLKKFSCFSKLPLELRWMIWKFSLPGRRVVEILYDHESGQCRSPSKTPDALHACSESRRVALESYSLAFATSQAPSQIYFDFKVDQLHIGIGNISTSNSDPAHDVLTAIPRADVSRIQNLSIDAEIEWFIPHPDFDNYAQREVGYGLSNLKTLTITEGDDDDLDFIMHASKDESAELHVWSVNISGKAKPFHLPSERDCAGAGAVSAIWATFEESRFAGQTNVSTIRVVSRDRLTMDKQWRKRVRFLENQFYNTITGCIYNRDKTIHKLEIMQRFHPNDFAELELRLSKDYVDLWNPFWIHANQTPCSCKVGHRFQWAAEGIDLSGLDIDACIEEIYAGGAIREIRRH